MMGILDSDVKRALKNRRKVENKIQELKKSLEKFNINNQTAEEKIKVYEIMSEIEELYAMISID